ncbi:hypothetical protein, partial [Algoriphagus sp.]|uniref:hypothetical protein n=1 Tax=Algoriphagus sp. TaxID=1872435 RepID=UPI0025D9F269
MEEINKCKAELKALLIASFQKKWSYLLVFICFIACESKQVFDYSLKFAKSDTTLLNDGNFRFLGTNYEVSDKNNYLIIHQGREIYWFDFKVDSIVKSINLDTTNLILPTSKLQNVLFLEDSNSLFLLFPNQNKIIGLDENLNIIKELDLKGIKESGFILMPYGRAFYYNELSNQFAIGMISNQIIDLDRFLNETRFLGVFDGENGELKVKFGRFDENNR